MIFIEFYDGQGLGNQLWVYVAGKKLSRKLGREFKVLSYEKFKGKDFLEIDCGSQKEIKPLHIFKEKYFLDKDLGFYGIDFDPSILYIKENTKIDGYFQSEKYFFDAPEIGKDILSIKEEWNAQQIIEVNSCILNVRGGEYRSSKQLSLPKSYWLSAMDNMKRRHSEISSFIIVTDDRRYASKLLPGLDIISGSIPKCYIALNQAKYLIVSNSSFSYFPIKTSSSNPNVIAPLHWARFNNPLCRWASPANYYESWSYQGADGNIVDPSVCHDDYVSTMREYLSYNVLAKYDSRDVFKKNPYYFLKKAIPIPLKEIIKKVLNY